MQQMIDDLKSIPGVIGAFGYRAKQGIFCNNLPSLFKQERLFEVAKSLAKIAAAGRLGFPDMNEVLINFEESVILCRPLGASDFLITVCDPSINMNLLALSLNLALEDFDPTAAEAPAAIVPRIDPAQLRESGPLVEPLQAMVQMLAKVMGPMAGIVFNEALESWANEQPPTPARLPALQESLCREIGDPEKAERFRKLVESQLVPKGH
jgi:hypothetical protein